MPTHGSDMSAQTDHLRDIFMDVSEDGELVEPQAEGPSRDPVDEEAERVEATIAGGVGEDGLDDALDDDFGEAAGGTA